jgi:hypothetical protein
MLTDHIAQAMVASMLAQRLRVALAKTLMPRALPTLTEHASCILLIVHRAWLENRIH